MEQQCLQQPSLILVRMSWGKVTGGCSNKEEALVPATVFASQAEILYILWILGMLSSLTTT
jgi:hypothetical protein